jgi:hypothetical protein
MMNVEITEQDYHLSEPVGEAKHLSFEVPVVYETSMGEQAEVFVDNAIDKAEVELHNAKE